MDASISVKHQDVRPLAIGVPARSPAGLVGSPVETIEAEAKDLATKRLAQRAARKAAKKAAEAAAPAVVKPKPVKRLLLQLV
jgi:hypothetical protein